MPNQPRRYVLLNRDGVINRRIIGGYVTSWQHFEFLPHALDALRLLAENGYASLAISHQAGVSQKLMTVANLELITRRFMMEAALAGGNIIQVYYCVHGAEDGCSCRKPQPGLIKRAQLDYGFVPQDTFFVGDSPEDIAVAARAGCPSIRVWREAFLEKREAGERPAAVASNLYEAAQVIIARQRHDDLWMQNPATEPEPMRSFSANHN